MLHWRPTHTVVVISFLYFSAYPISGVAGSLSVQSPAEQVGLLELYTSEGCSSCPPADRWLSKLKEEPRLWQKVIPLAFHVDYWDYIGWKDRFASPAFTARQYQYAAEEAMRTVYTPGFFLNGKEWRWRSRSGDGWKNGGTVGVLSLDADEQTAKVRFQTPLKHRHLSATVALLGFGIQTDVKAGENNGRTLTHDFIVLSTKQTKLTKSGDEFTGTLPLPEPGVKAPRLALVAWVHNEQSQRPVQAVGGWLTN